MSVWRCTRRKDSHFREEKDIFSMPKVSVPEGGNIVDEDDRERQLKWMNAIARIQRGVFKKIDLEQIAAVLVEELSSLLDISGCAMFVVAADDSVGVLAREGFSETHRAEQLLDDDSLIRHILTTGRQVVAGDVRADADLSARLPDGWPARSLMCLPLVGGEQARGLLYLESMSEDGFGEEEQNFLQMMADLLLLAVERSVLRSQIEVLSTHDSLTGCLKRIRLEEDLKTEVDRSKRYRRPLSLVLMALRWFQVDQQIPAPERDDGLMKELGAILISFKRNTDSIYRYQEGQFIAVLPETDGHSALKMARRVRDAVEQGKLVQKIDGRAARKVSVHTAVVSYPWDGNTPGELLESAHAALRQAQQDDGRPAGLKAVPDTSSEK